MTFSETNEGEGGITSNNFTSFTWCEYFNIMMYISMLNYDLPFSSHAHTRSKYIYED